MDPNTRLGERLIARGVDRARVAEAFEQARDPSRGDLAEVLVAEGHISAALAEEVRAAIRAELTGSRLPILFESSDGEPAEPPNSEPPNSELSSPEPVALGSERPSETTSDVPGLRLGPVLAAGGMGRIHLATDLETGAEVVVKRLLTARSPGGGRSPVPVTPASQDAIERFEREARALADVRHPNIVPVHRFGHSADGPWIVMARIEGRSLDEVLEAEPELARSAAGVKRIKRWFTQLAEALEALHRAGLVHRDLKPDNLLITDTGDDLILVDLGLARRLESHSEGQLESLTKTGGMVGTPGYMAPEQLGKGGRFGDVSPATDVWGLAASLFYALTGEPPISGGSVAAMSVALVSGRIPTPSSIAGRLDPVLESICVAALTTNQSRRPELSVIHRALTEEQPLKVLPSNRRWLPAALVALAFPAVVALVMRDATAPKLHLEAREPVVTRERRVEIRGRIEDANPAYVLIGDREVHVDGRGDFRGVVELESGRQTLTFVAVDKGGLHSTPVELVVTCDREPPTLRFGRPERPAAGRFELEITASEPGCTLHMGARPWRFRGDRLALQVGLHELSEARCEVEDPAGNRAPVRLPLRLIGSDSRGLAAILAVARPGDWLILPPGRKRIAIAGQFDATIVALEPGKTELAAVDERPAIRLTGGSLRLDGVQLTRTETGGAATESGPAVVSARTKAALLRPLIAVSAGRLALSGCGLTSSGAGIQIDGRAEVRLADCRFQTYGSAVYARLSTVLARRTRFENLGALPIGRAFLAFESCPRVELIGCDVIGARDHGIYVVASRAILELCRVHKSVNRGLNIDAGLVDLIGCEFVESGEDGLRADDHSRLRIAASIFEGNGALGKVQRQGLSLISGSILDGRSLVFGDGGGALRVEQGGVIRLGRVRGLGADRLLVRPSSRIDCGDHDYRRLWNVDEELTASEARSRTIAEWLSDLRERGPVGKRACSALRLRVEELDEDIIRKLADAGLIGLNRAREVLAARRSLPTGILARVAFAIARRRWTLSNEVRALFTRAPLEEKVVDAIAHSLEVVSSHELRSYLGLLDGSVATPALDRALAARWARESSIPNLIALTLAPRTATGRAEQLTVLEAGLAGHPEAGRLLILRAAFEALQTDSAARERLVKLLRAEPSEDVRAGVVAWLPAGAYPLAERRGWLQDAEARRLAARGELLLARSLADSRTEGMPANASSTVRRRVMLAMTRRPIDKEELALLLEAAKSDSAILRTAAAAALPWAGDSETVKATLKGLIGDDDRRVAEIAGGSLKWLIDPKLARPPTAGTTLLDTPR